MTETENTGLTITQQSFLALNKASIRDVAMQLVDKCHDGYESYVNGLILSKKLAELAELLKENLKNHAANELKLATKEKRFVHGCEIKEQMTGVKYDYASCEDKIWNDLNTKKAEREALLRAIKGQMVMVDEDSGETWIAKEPVTSGGLSLIVTIK